MEQGCGRDEAQDTFLPGCVNSMSEMPQTGAAINMDVGELYEVRFKSHFL